MPLTIDARMLYHSGIGTTLRNILRRLPELSERDTIYAPNEKSREFLAPLFKRARIRLNRAPIYSVAEQISMGRHAMNSGLFWSPHYNIPLAHRGRLVVTIHDTLHLAHPELFGGLARQFYARFMLSAAVKRASAVICVSDFTRRELHRLVGVDPAKVHVIHNGVDEDWFDIPPGPPPHPRPYLLFVGNVKPHKNLVRLISAFEKIASRIPHDLLIVGQREGFKSMDENLSQRAGTLGSRIQFTGLVEDAVLKQLVAHASLFVFPSYYEGFGLPPLEAMAAGVPTVAARAGAVPEVCGDGVAYFDPFDESEMAQRIVDQLQLDESARKDITRRARERARGFSWDATAAKTWQLLEDSAGGDLK